MALIIKVKLELLLPKNSKKSPYTTPISKSSGQQISKQVMPWG